MRKITFVIGCLLAGLVAHAQYESMAIVGDGTGPGGWPGQENNPGPEDVYQMTSDDGINWFIDDLVTYSGSVKFRAENSWDNNWGGSTFPSGTGVFNSDVNITTIPGTYDVTFNSTTLEYNFESQNDFSIISLVGPGVVGGSWDSDTDLLTADGIDYAIIGVALNGEVKFRENHSWQPNNWAPLEWPSGTAVFDDPGSAMAPEGFYKVYFNRETLAYSFEYPTVALVGSATPDGWPADPQVDEHIMATTDGVHYTLNSITLTEGAVKFRQENGWNVQWGGDSFPDGTGAQNGSDISVTPGTYSVTLDRSTGAYSFADPVASTDEFEKTGFTVYPNPASQSWNIAFNGHAESIELTDMLGKVVARIPVVSNTVSIDASALSSGMYVARISSAAGSQTVKLVKN